MGMVIGLLITAAVIGGGVYISILLMPKKDPDVLDAEPVTKSSRRKGAGKALAVSTPNRIESEVKVDAVAVQLPKHVVVKTWMAVEWGVEEYKWKCACGRVDGSSSQNYSRDKAATHVRDSNRAEELKAQTNGRFSW